MLLDLLIDQSLILFDPSFSFMISKVDRIAHREFVSWLEKRCPTSDHPFLESIEKYDVIPCLEFLNQEVGLKICHFSLILWFYSFH